MRIRRQPENGADIINVSSLVDVMFILIIFFLATTTFQQEERDIKVSLPESAEGNALSAVTKVLVVNVRQDGTYLLGSNEATLQQIYDTMTKSVKDSPDQKVLIRGDEKALHGHVAAAVSACKRAGINEANIGYKMPQ